MIYCVCRACALRKLYRVSTGAAVFFVTAAAQQSSTRRLTHRALRWARDTRCVSSVQPRKRHLIVESADWGLVAALQYRFFFCGGRQALLESMRISATWIRVLLVLMDSSQPHSNTSRSRVALPGARARVRQLLTPRKEATSQCQTFASAANRATANLIHKKQIGFRTA